MTRSPLKRFFQRVVTRFGATLRESMFDKIIVGATVLYIVVYGLVTERWEIIAPFVWGVCIIVAYHAFEAAYAVSREIKEEIADASVEKEIPVYTPAGQYAKVASASRAPKFYRLQLYGVAFIIFFLCSFTSVQVWRMGQETQRPIVRLGIYQLLPPTLRVPCVGDCSWLDRTKAQIWFSNEGRIPITILRFGGTVVASDNALTDEQISEAVEKARREKTQKPAQQTPISHNETNHAFFVAGTVNFEDLHNMQSGFSSLYVIAFMSYTDAHTNIHSHGLTEICGIYNGSIDFFQDCKGFPRMLMESGDIR